MPSHAACSTPHTVGWIWAGSGAASVTNQSPCMERRVQDERARQCGLPKSCPHPAALPGICTENEAGISWGFPQIRCGVEGHRLSWGETQLGQVSVRDQEGEEPVPASLQPTITPQHSTGTRAPLPCKPEQESSRETGCAGSQDGGPAFLPSRLSVCARL